MQIISRKHNVKNTKFNTLKGSGLLPITDDICKLDKCKPKPLSVPAGPIPKPQTRGIPTPLCARKTSKKDNRWVLNGITYPNFNTLWINIPYKHFTVLKVKTEN